MRIAQIVPSLLRSGPGIVAHTLSSSLVNEGHSVDVYYFDELAGLDFPCQVSRISMDHPIEFNSYDIIHSHGFRPDKYVHSHRKLIGNAATVSTLHQNIFKDLRFRRGLHIAIPANLIWQYYLASKDAVVPISQYLHNNYRGSIKRITSPVYNGVKVDYMPILQNDDFKTKIISLKDKGLKVLGLYADITKIKGIDQIIRLMAIRDDFAAVIIGDGSEKENLIKMAEPFADRTLFLPKVYHPYNYLENIDLFLMLSHNEGFGMSTIEAIAAKTPAVCSDIPVNKELFNDNEVSFFTLDNMDSLSNAIDRSLKLADSLTKHAYEKYLNFFTEHSMYKGYLDVYHKLAGV